MDRLELKVPPPGVALLAGLLMWGVARLGPLLAMPEGMRRGIAGVLMAMGIGIAVSALAQFWRARTTVHPEKPEKTSALVTTGIFRLTRNPMYVGLASVLLGWAVWLRAPWALLGPALFMLYIQRFQMVPEERVLAGKFGERYASYCQRVRRWL